MFNYKTKTLFVVFLITQIIFSCSGLETSESLMNKTNEFWNEADSELAADSLVSTILNLELLKGTKNQKPKIIVGSIINNSSEKLDSDLIEKNIERSFLNSGNVTFISAKVNRVYVRDERKHSSDFSDKNEFKRYLKPFKSDFFIDGEINLNIDSLSNPIVKEYRLSIQIINSKNLKEIASNSWSIIK
jgi:penicillin-binding protein activator